MADHCCSSCAEGLEAGSGARRNVLIAVLLINAVIFVGELGAGLWAHSSALQADSVDMLMDAVVYGISLFALSSPAHARARAALVNGSLQLVLAAGILGQLAHQILLGAEPMAPFMIIVGAVALAANFSVAGLLMRFRREDINMRAVWLCTRNDVIGNAATLIAGAVVLTLATPWPDWMVGALIALLFVRTSIGVMRDAWGEMRHPAPAA